MSILKDNNKNKKNVNDIDHTDVDTIDRKINSNFQCCKENKHEIKNNVDSCCKDQSHSQKTQNDVLLSLKKENKQLIHDFNKQKILIDERIEDLKRLKAEFINYKNRVERDKRNTKILTLFDLFSSLIPVLDDIDAANKYGDLNNNSPLSAIIKKFQTILKKYGLEKYDKNEIGNKFDPFKHEAVSKKTASKIKNTNNNKQLEQKLDVVHNVFRSGYKIKNKIIRAAQVSVLAKIKKIK